MSDNAGKSLLKSLSRIAAKELKNTRGVNPFWKEKADLVIHAYGFKEVLEDFEQWAVSVKENPPENPVAVYLKMVDARLGTVVANPEADEIMAASFEFTRQAPPLRSTVLELLDQYSKDDILGALKEFTSGLDDYGLKQATKNFFHDGGVHGIILARKNRAAAEKKLQDAEEKALRLGLAKIEQERRSQEVADLEEQKVIERMQKNPNSPF